MEGRNEFGVVTVRCSWTEAREWLEGYVWESTGMEAGLCASVME
jgi:hypothetical protein